MSKTRRGLLAALLALAGLFLALLSPYAADARAHAAAGSGSSQRATARTVTGAHAGAARATAAHKKKHKKKRHGGTTKAKKPGKKKAKKCYRVLRKHVRHNKIRKVRVRVPCAAPTQHDNRPNVVMVMMDDMRWDEMAYAPTVNSVITSRGTTFANSFSPFPLCCPARASFLLGKYPHNHGVISTDLPYGFGSINDSHTIGTAMRAGGYRTAMIGKYLNGYGVMPSKVTGQTASYIPPGWDDWMGSLDTNTQEKADYRGGTYNYLQYRQNINGQLVTVPGVYSSDRIADEAVEVVNRDHYVPRPFFLWLTPVAPHHGLPVDPTDPADSVRADGSTVSFPSPFVPPPYRGLFNSWISHSPGIPVSHGAEDDVSDKPDYIRALPATTGYENAAIAEVERQRAASIYAWDQAFARVVNALKATGEYANTIFIFTSDNGYYLGEHRIPVGKINPHEPSIRTPLVMAGPGIAHRTSYDPAITEDLPATILDLAGSNAAPEMTGIDGQSLVPELRGNDHGWTRSIDVEGYFAGRANDPDLPAGLTHSGIRTARWKYIRYSNGEEELYDLRTDPNELTSLDKDPAYADIKAELVAWWKQQKKCDGPECSTPLPPDLSATPAQAHDLVTAFDLARDAYYNH